VELDELRYRSLVDPEYWRTLDVASVIRDGRVGVVLASVALASIQKRVGDKLGIRPGAEMLAAARRAEAIGARLVLADRSIQVTFQRTWHNLGVKNRLKLLAFLVMAPLSSIEEDIDADAVERLKEEGSMHDMMAEFARAMPQVKEPLIDERNQYLMSMVREAPGRRVVAVVGAAHVSAWSPTSTARSIARPCSRSLGPPPSSVPCAGHCGAGAVPHRRRAASAGSAERRLPGARVVRSDGAARPHRHRRRRRQAAHGPPGDAGVSARLPAARAPPREADRPRRGAPCADRSRRTGSACSTTSRPSVASTATGRRVCCSSRCCRAWARWSARRSARCACSGPCSDPPPTRRGAPTSAAPPAARAERLPAPRWSR
jgi:hypothetical protein